MIFFCLILVISLIALGYFTLMSMKKSDTLKKQLMFITKQNDSLRSKVTNEKQKEHFNIIYNAPKYKLGLISKDCSLYIAPSENLPQINTLKENTKMYILDSAEVNSNLWFYVSIYSSENVNNKGWLKEECLSFIEEISEDI